MVSITEMLAIIIMMIIVVIVTNDLLIFAQQIFIECRLCVRVCAKSCVWKNQ